jgi:enoyl-[acyl-carrier protein] reductase I
VEVVGAAAAAASSSSSSSSSSGGSIVALSFIGSQRAGSTYRVMGACKASLEASARQLAAELGPRKIRVNVISPGPVDTLAARGIPGFTGMREDAAKRSPLGRGVTGAEVGALAGFLASDGAAGITGQTLYVDGGFSAVL